jgi:hypothetical protein
VIQQWHQCISPSVSYRTEFLESGKVPLCVLVALAVLASPHSVSLISNCLSEFVD